MGMQWDTRAYKNLGGRFLEEYLGGPYIEAWL